MSKRLLAVLVSMAASALWPGAGSAWAVCTADRLIFAPYSYVYTPGVINGLLDSTVTAEFTGSFWALGEGHPVGLAGIDNGKFEAIDGHFDGWLTIRPRVADYGYPPLIESSWSATPAIDGCIDTTGSDPDQPDQQQCMVVLFADQRAGAGYFAVSTAAADAAGDYDLSVPGDAPILLSEIPHPISGFDPDLDDSTNTVTIAPPQLDGSGQFGHPDCPEVLVGYRVYRQIVPRGSDPPVDRTRDDGPGIGWEVALGGQLPSGQPLPLTREAGLTFFCEQRSDVYLAFSLAFDSGYETPYLSANHLQFPIDCCSDADRDGVCAEPGESRAHDCDDANPRCAVDCTDADLDQHCPPGDCDDASPAIHGHAAETCDGIDNNCDGRRDEVPIAIGPVTATGAAPLAAFGQTAAALVDVDHDGYDDFIVGAGRDTANGVIEAGSATVFSGLARAPLQRLLHPEPQSGDQFASVLARIGDVNADGVDDILIGAEGDDTAAGVDAGSAFIFSGSAADAFELLHVLEDPAGASGDRLGAAVAALADQNGDGVADVALGVPGADGDRGRVLVFSGAGGLLMRTVTDPAGHPGAGFGCSVSSIDDLDSNGVHELLVGSCAGDSPVSSGAGKVTVFTGHTWQPLVTLFDPLGEVEDGFGGSIAALDDVDFDSIADVLIGVADDDDPVGGIDSGSALLFSGAGGSPIRRFVDSAPSGGDRFGAVVARVGDLDGDGVADVGIGSPAGDVGGSVSLFSSATGELIRKLESSSGSANVGFGSAIVRLGDLDDDGVADLLIGSPGAGDTGTGTGNADAFSGAGTLDLDGDGTGDLCDCAPSDPAAQAQPGVLSGLALSGASPTLLTWPDPGAGFTFDVAGGLLSELRAHGGLDAAACVIEDSPAAAVHDDRPQPASGDGYYYLPRARNACGAGGYGLDSAGVERRPGNCP